MDRVVEPELMDEDAQARAYAEAYIDGRAARNSGSAGNPTSSAAATKQSTKRGPSSSIPGPFPACILSIDEWSLSCSENRGGPPSTSAQ